MKCPFCNENKNRVIDTRDVSDGIAIWRRRRCKSCDGRFTTYERIENSPRKIIKKDNTREDFDRSKIREGIERACEKRPVKSEEIQEIVDDIEQRVFERDTPEIPAREIGEMVMERLKELDDVAYIRFASVYREFKDVSEFMSELRSILQEEKKRQEVSTRE